MQTQLSQSLNFRLAKEDMEQIDYLCSHFGVSRATLIRWACRDWLDRVAESHDLNLKITKNLK